jgi:hypothetical protein
MVDDLNLAGKPAAKGLPVTDAPERALVVMAHPDDADFGADWFLDWDARVVRTGTSRPKGGPVR